MQGVLDKILTGKIEFDTDAEPTPTKKPSKAWRNHWLWLHPVECLPRPDGPPIQPGGKFFTRRIYPTAEIAEAKAHHQMTGSTGFVWPSAVRPHLKYLGPVPVETSE